MRKLLGRFGDIAEPTQQFLCMCLAIPGKIINIASSTHAKVDFGGVCRKVNIELIEPRVGDYVVVHAGFAISVLNEKDARESLKLIEVQSSKL